MTERDERRAWLRSRAGHLDALGSEELRLFARLTAKELELGERDSALLSEACNLLRQFRPSERRYKPNQIIAEWLHNNFGDLL